ncbi:ATP-binding protein [Streptomyces sp. XC 2026]|uniref:ATP-binding protein n=1 Tax=Streptomyces sp. XC 2026 TaxID=2782004 RepID=UPI001F184CCC|nr:tetratricopeptide repeat protein [Streptomyces sp. XC 2026]
MSAENELSGSARDAVQAGSISGGVHFHDHVTRPDGSGGRVPRQLPADVRGFVNRAAELDQLNAVLPGEDGTPLVVSVCLIAGTAGAGKTSLALRWAHRVQERFPDGQLYINLRGYDPGEPVTAREALHRFLSALGVPAQGIPDDPEAASALYRSLLADRRVLIVLDNAATVAQVRPLLPGNSHSLTVVTSRGRLSGLAIRDGAHRLTLGTLPEPEAVALLRAVTAGYRPEDDTGKLAELARLCARLPLALRIAAERAATHPHLTLDDLIADLRDESALWDALSTGDEDEAEAVRTVFAWSYRSLPPEAARLFRLLGLHPGREFGIGATTALAGTPARRTRQLLDILVGAHILEQTAPDRYEFHDLLRAYATDQAQRDETSEDRRAALRRLLDWYLHAAAGAAEWIQPAERPLPLTPPLEGVIPPAFGNYDRAVDWSEREHATFLPLIRSAEAAQEDRYAWLLSDVLWSAKAPSATIHDWLVAGEIGVRAVRRLGNRQGEARLLDYLGMGHMKLHALTESRHCHEAALTVWRELGDHRGEAESLNLLGLVELRTRRLDAAQEHFERAGLLFRERGERQREAMTLANRAAALLQAGHLPQAAEDAGAALAIHREPEVRRSVGNALRILSEIHCAQGEIEAALGLAEEALEIALDLRSPVMEGYWLITLGDAQREAGRHADALASYQRSATLHRRLGNRSREAMAWHGAGQTYRAMDRAAEAAGFFRQAAMTHRDLGDGWHEAVSLAALADMAPTEAVTHLTRAEGLLTGFADPRAVALREVIGARLRRP